MTCTFFGHRNAPKEVMIKLNEIIIDLIENERVSNFLVGNQGAFDSMVIRKLIELKEVYPIRFEIVLAYLPDGKGVVNSENDINMIYPEGIERVPKKFAINYRNEWMIKQSDYVVTYVKYDVGGASKFKEYAERKKKNVINITL